MICGYAYTLGMSTATHQSRALAAQQMAKRLGLSQQQIAEAVGASQSQVSRVLRGKGVRDSRLFLAVCIYVELQSAGVTKDAVLKNTELVEALTTTWNGTQAHAQALAAVIRSLGALSLATEAPPAVLFRRRGS